MQRAAGVSSFGDISQLLNTAPREVVELLRITAVVRSVTGPLGALRPERLRLNGACALRGLPAGAPVAGAAGAAASAAAGAAAAAAAAQGEAAGGGGGAAAGAGAAGGDAASDAGSVGRVATGGGGGGDDAAARLKIEARLALIRGYCAARTLTMRLLLAALHVFGQSVPLS